MVSPPQPQKSQLICLLLILSLLLRNADGAAKTSIVFATLGRSHYSFDLFFLPVPQLSSTTGSSSYDDPVLDETRLTDGHSVNYNGFFPSDPPALLSLLNPSSTTPPLASTPLDAVVYVSERNGTSNLYLDVLSAQTPSDPFSASARGSVLQIPARLQLPLIKLPSAATDDGSSILSVSLKDRPSITGQYVVYVSTHEDPLQPRKSWAAVYSTHVQTGATRRLTPTGVADFSPAVSPDGRWTAVASSGEEGWTGEVQELRTGIYVFQTKDGSKRSKIIERGGWPSWSPDGSSLYFHRESEDGWWSVYRAAIDASTSGIVVTSVERLTPPGFHAFTPAAGKGFVALATRRPESSEFRHIELLDLATGTLVELTKRVSPHSNHYNPFISPDSARVGYHRCRGSANPLLLESIRSPVPDISLFRLDGSYPSFSPDGKRIAYVGLPGLYVVDADGRNMREVFKRTAFPSAWDWKRKNVIYTSHGPTFAGERTEVDVISITLPDDPTAGSPAIKKLSTGGANNAFPSPSPDGKWLVFRSGRSGHKNLYIMDAVEGERAAGGVRRLTEGNWTDTMCNWSPDGNWIAFASDRDNPGAGGFAVYFIRPDGTGLHRVVHSAEGGRVNHPFFSPDSKSFVFTTDYAAVSAEPIANPHHYQPYGDIFVAKVDGSGIRRLTHNSYEDGTPTWGPVFMEPKDVIESPPTAAGCSFEDCQWLAEKKKVVHDDYPAARGCRAA